MTTKPAKLNQSKRLKNTRSLHETSFYSAPIPARAKNAPFRRGRSETIQSVSIDGSGITSEMANGVFEHLAQRDWATVESACEINTQRRIRGFISDLATRGGRWVTRVRGSIMQTDFFPRAVPSIFQNGRRDPLASPYRPDGDVKSYSYGCVWFISTLFCRFGWAKCTGARNNNVIIPWSRRVQNCAPSGRGKTTIARKQLSLICD